MFTFKKSSLIKLVVLYAIIFLVLGALLSIRHHFFLKNLGGFREFTEGVSQKKLSDFPGLTNRQIVNIGWAHRASNPPSNSYLYFPREKRKGKVRVGLFGDSFVEGAETKKGFDISSFLQQKFHHSGFPHVEVLNFGVGAYGVHQSLLLWEYLGQYFDLDYSIFIIYPWQKRRDRTFMWGYNHFAPAHARYIIENEKLSLMPVDGANRTEAGFLYNSLIPPWKYIRYDEKPPAFLRALVPINRTIKINPFYYRLLERDEEILLTYAKLFENLPTDKTEAIVVCNSRSMCEFQKSMSTSKPYVLNSQLEKYFRESQMVYKAPRNHLSALGNQLRADELFSLLRGEDQPNLDFLKIDKIQHPSYLGPSTSSPLFAYSNVSVNILEREVATFVTKAEKQKDWRWNKNLDFQEEKIFSLLWVSEDKSLFFIPTNFLLSDKEPVFLEFKKKNQLFQVPIGKVMASNPLVGNITLYRKGKDRCFSERDSGWKFCFESANLQVINFEATGTIEDVQIVVGEDRKKILSSKILGEFEKNIEYLKNLVPNKRKKTVELLPALATIARLRSRPGNFVELQQLKQNEGTLDLVVSKANDASHRFPIVFYKIFQPKVSSFDPPYPNPINLPLMGVN